MGSADKHDSALWRRLAASAARMAERARATLPALGRGNQFVGDYPSWAEAQRDTGGYDAPKILEKALQATLKVRSGEAAYERDTVLFDRIEYSFPLLASLLYAASRDRGALGVLDFGGALGSSYFQNRQLLAHLAGLRWGVVEQAHFVTAGRERIADEHLSFHHTIAECCSAIRPNFALASSVLSYVESPYAVLEKLQGLELPFICLDRTFVSLSGGTRLTVQIVPPEFYQASYPCWILDEAELISRATRGYRLLYDFESIDGGEVRLPGLRGVFKGYLFLRA
jgi:putative methyltransferase (TIGR04325 family)